MIVNGLKILQKVRTPGNRPDKQEKNLCIFAEVFSYLMNLRH